MARRNIPTNGGSNPYGSNEDRYRQAGRSPYEADSRAVRSGQTNPQGQPSLYGQANPYGSADPYARGDSSGRPSNPYGQADPYAQRGSSRPSDARRRRHVENPQTAYPVGSGRTYTSSQQNDAANRAAGVRPVNAQDLLRSPYASTMRDKHGNKGPLLSRRGFLAAAGGTAVAAIAMGFVGVNWYTHRAVACTVDGTARDAPIGSSAADLVKRGYSYPKAGNLVSIAAEGETPTVLQEGGGEPYTVTVNGEPVNPETWRLSEGDEVVFTSGADLTEPVSVQQTEIPCAIQYPEDSRLLNPIGYVSQWGRNGVSTIETGQVSGRTIDRGVTQEPQDLIITTGHINPSDGRLLVALTFDDGPSPTYTPQYLDVLSRYGAKATFFNLGTQLEGGPEYTDLAKRCADEGHQVASHTYSHDDITLTGMSVEARNEEIGKTFTLVSNATGVLTEVMRPPFGEFRGKGYLEYLESGQNISYSAYWTVDSLDWDVASKMGLDDGASQIVANCTQGLSGDNYNGAIILMHDGGGDRSRDVLALPRIIETFQSAGYEFVTLNEMLASDPAFPSWVTTGYVERPAGSYVPDASLATPVALQA